MKAGKRARPRAGFFTKLVILALLVLVGWHLYSLRGQVAAAETEKAAYAAQVEEKQRENAALKADIAEGPTTEKLEEIARDELGLVKPDEYVFETRN